MANKVIIKQFKNKAKKPVAGLTPEHAIYDKNGVRLDAKLGNVNLQEFRDLQQQGVNAIKSQETKSIQAVADREAEILAKSDAAEVSFDNTGTSLSATNVQDALKETNGKLFELESEVIYDVTANNDGATFSSLSALLSSENLSTLIPTSVRHGGISIRFVQSSDNKYVQCLYVGIDTMTATFTNVDNWVKINIEGEVNMFPCTNITKLNILIKELYVKGLDLTTVNAIRIFNGFKESSTQKYRIGFVFETSTRNYDGFVAVDSTTLAAIRNNKGLYEFPIGSLMHVYWVCDWSNISQSETSFIRIENVNILSSNIDYCPTILNFVKNKYDTLKYKDSSINLQWEEGGINQYGEETTGYSRTPFLIFDLIQKIEVNNTKLQYFLYDSNKTFIEYKNHASLNFNDYKNNNAYYVRFSSITDQPNIIEGKVKAYTNIRERFSSLKKAIDEQISDMSSSISNIKKAIDMSLSIFDDIAVCGDSYTKGAIYSGSTSIGYKQNISWGKILGRMIGANILIYAEGGRTTKTWQTTEDCLIKCLNDAPHKLYILALGINDYSAKMDLGTIDDIKSDYTQNPDTFYGNYGKIISQLMAHAPNAKFIISTVFLPTYHGGSYYDYSANAIKEIASHFRIQFIDTKDDDYLCSSDYNNAIDRHGAHPTAPTYSAIAVAVKKLIEKNIYTNIGYYETFYD